MSTAEYEARLARRLAEDTPGRLDSLTGALRELRAPLPADSPYVGYLRDLDRSWANVVALQEKETGLPYPDCFAPPVAAESATPTPIEPNAGPVERSRRKSA